MFLLLQLALFGLALSASVPFPLVAQDAALDNEVLPMDKCWPLMESVGLSARFPGAVSHAIHSLTLEDLRHYFDPQAQEKNGIPIINFDLTSEEMLLPNAPSSGVEQGFMTMSLRAADQVLSHMDNRDYDLAHYTPLERLVHALHMQEVWEMMSKQYHELVKNPPKDKQVCNCVRNVNQNGVKKFLNYMALKIRYPDVMYGKSLEMSQDDPESFQFQEDAEKQDLPKSGANSKGVGKGDYDVIGVYNFEFGKDKENKLPEQDLQSKSEGSKGRYKWEGNIYKFNFQKKPKEAENQINSKKEDSNVMGKYDWNGNLYKFNFPKNQRNALQQEKSKPREKPAKGNYDWDENVYKLNFQKNEKNAQGEEKLDKEKTRTKGNYDWDANLYKFNFPKNLKNAPQGAEEEKSSLLKNTAKKNYDSDSNLYKFNLAEDNKNVDKLEKSNQLKENIEGSYNWDSNIYKFNFPKESKADAQSSKGELLEPWQIKDEGMVHLRNEASWKVWRQAMLDMDEADHYEAAFFIYCMIN